MHSKVIQPYVDHLNRVLNKTITQSRLSTIEGKQAVFAVIVRFQNDSIQPLELGNGYFLHFLQEVEEVGRHIVVHEARYILALSADINDDSRHLFRWEYLLAPPEPNVPQSHLHVYASHPEYGSMEPIHFPTRRLSVEQIIWLLVNQWHIPYLDANWYAIARKGHLDFVRRTAPTEAIQKPFP